MLTDCQSRIIQSSKLWIQKQFLAGKKFPKNFGVSNKYLGLKKICVVDVVVYVVLKFMLGWVCTILP